MKCFMRMEFTRDEIQTRTNKFSTCYINAVVRQRGNYVTFWSLQQYIWKHGVRSCQYQTSSYITDSEENICVIKYILPFEVNQCV